MAWNELSSLIGDDLHFEHDPPMVAPLNKKLFTREALSQDSCVATAGLVGKGILQDINRALEKKFKGQASPVLLPSWLLTPRPQDIVTYAYLFKNMEFPVPFESLDDPLMFAGVPLSSFGLGAYKSEHHKLYPQV